MTNAYPTRWIATLAWAACALAVACAAVALVAGPGYRMAWWPLAPGIMIIRWAAMAALGAAVVSLIAAVMARGADTRRPLYVALAGLVIALAVALPPISLYLRAQNLPHIHDITTDTENPPAFVAIVPLRQGASNTTAYSAETAALQKQGYPDIAPVMLNLAPAQAYARAESAARSMGWAVVAASPEDLRIEATDTTLLFGFKDDVVIRVTPQAAGSRIDVRSLSRVGGSDFGVNAKRIRRFMEKLVLPQPV
jgi:uncharacterized protein (DUF1499 family)